MIPCVLDCDPGHDDAVAILLATARPELDLRAITADFYQRFYHVKPSEAQIDKVLQGRG